MGSWLSITAETTSYEVRIHVAHGFMKWDAKRQRNEYYRSMTGQVFTIHILYRGRVAMGDYSYAVANDRLINDRIFYPTPDGLQTGLPAARKWFRTTAIRLMRKFWKEHRIDEEPDKIKELRAFVNTALKTIQEYP
jgi:hypothetical protein